jgi:curved DNA-binding protein CbpA
MPLSAEDLKVKYPGMFQEGANAYEVIGVTQSASDTEIRKKYLELSLQFHPDKHPEAEETFTVLFKNLGEAYGILSDRNLRGTLNQELRQAPPANRTAKAAPPQPPKKATPAYKPEPVSPEVQEEAEKIEDFIEQESADELVKKIPGNILGKVIEELSDDSLGFIANCCSIETLNHVFSQIAPGQKVAARSLFLAASEASRERIINGIELDTLDKLIQVPLSPEHKNIYEDNPMLQSIFFQALPERQPHVFAQIQDRDKQAAIFKKCPLTTKVELLQKVDQDTFDAMLEHAKNPEEICRAFLKVSPIEAVKPLIETKFPYLIELTITYNDASDKPLVETREQRKETMTELLNFFRSSTSSITSGSDLHLLKQIIEKELVSVINSDKKTYPKNRLAVFHTRKEFTPGEDHLSDIISHAASTKYKGTSTQKALVNLGLMEIKGTKLHTTTELKLFEQFDPAHANHRTAPQR